MKVGDKVIWINGGKDNFWLTNLGRNELGMSLIRIHTVYKSYVIEKIYYGLNLIITNELKEWDIQSYVISTDCNFAIGFSAKEFDEYFISEREYRKLKLKKLDESWG